MGNHPVLARRLNTGDAVVIGLGSMIGEEVINPRKTIPRAIVIALGIAVAVYAIIAGLGRTSLAMAREADLPRWLAAVHPRFNVPHRAELVLAAVICLIISVADLRGAIGFSSFGVLIYYLVANLAAYTRTGEHRRYPKALQLAGAAACAVLAATLPVGSVVAGLVMFAAGILYRGVRLRLGRDNGTTGS